MKAENIEVTQEEYEKELETMAEVYQMEIAKVKDLMGEREKKNIMQDLAVRKVQANHTHMVGRWMFARISQLLGHGTPGHPVNLNSADQPGKVVRVDPGSRIRVKAGQLVHQGLFPMDAGFFGKFLA